ncbi:MAG: hypothetical protein JWR07_4390 [Nevskia sp.]|nr:hypothetical protein [Nevskia sp.]
MTIDTTPPNTTEKTSEQLAISWARTFIGEVTVPAFIVKNDGALVHLGSGVLFEARNQYFLITAQHILDGHTPSEICLPRRSGKERLRTIGTCLVLKPQNSKLDIAVIEFQREETIALLKQHARFVTPSNIGPIDIHASAYLCGYPTSLMKMEGGVLTETNMLLVRSWFPQTVSAELKDPPIQGVELFLNYSRIGLSDTGGEVNAPELEGVSGGGVWQAARSKNSSVWTIDSDLRLIGVQHSYKHDEFFRAMSWSIVYECFALYAPAIAQDIWNAAFPA